MPMERLKKFLKKSSSIIVLIIIAFFAVLQKRDDYKAVETKSNRYNNKIIILDRQASNELLFMQVGLREEEKSLPKKLRYTKINEIRLKEVLNVRNSLLIDEPYFSSIVTAAENLDIHPLFMFAILGQEQGFVPRDHYYAKSIVNNPFNVFGSWKVYNTTIKDSSEIAARTLINLSMDRPSGEDPIKWINLRGGQGGYAEDENWWIGVSSIFEKLKSETR